MNDLQMKGNNGLYRCMGCMELYEEQYDVCPYCGYSSENEKRQLLHLDENTCLADRYIVGRSLGYGGFGVTYLGWDEKLHRKVAIKEYLPSEFATRMVHHQNLMVDKNEKKLKLYKEGLDKFLNEGRKLAQVNDIEGIVHMYDCFEENNTAYITMEYLQGETLSDYMEKNGVIEEQVALDLILPILHALEIVHEKGIIHRDIAPDNLFVIKDEKDNLRLKLIDFGASKFASTSHSKSLTVIIKPGYSPEEQYRSNGEQGTYTDVYAIAAVLYKMVTGIQPPDSFERRTAIESHKRDLLVEPGRINKNLSGNFEIAILNALNVRVEDRTQSIEKFEEELISFEKVKRHGSSIKKIDFMRWPMWAKIGVPAASVFALGIAVYAVVKTFSGATEEFVMPEGYTRVVDYAMSDFSNEAQEWASDHQQIIEASRTEFSPVAASGIVLSQEQQPGTLVNVNSVIALTLSTGEEKYFMPDVTGMSLDDARKALECMGFDIITADGEKEGLVVGGVISQDVEPYELVNYGTTINLLVNQKGPNLQENIDQELVQAESVDMTNKSFEDALDVAAKNGMCVKVIDRFAGKDATKNVVYSQNFIEEDGVKVFELVVGMDQREFEIPNLRYKDKESAIQILKNIGVMAEIKEESSEIVVGGLVTSQDTKGAKTIKAGDTMLLMVSTGSKPFEMPEVTNLEENEARGLLVEKNLAVSIEYGYADNVQEGHVISQSIQAGEGVTRGTVASIVVCSSEGLVRIPDISGLSLEDATTLMINNKLEVQVDEQDSLEEKNTVLDIIPAMGTMQKEGSKVTIVTSNGKLLEEKLAAEKKAEEERKLLLAKQKEEAEKAEKEKKAAEEAKAKAEQEAKAAEEAARQAKSEEERKAAEEAAAAAEKAKQEAEEAARKAAEEEARRNNWVWSDWSTNVPAAGSESESKTQYRSRTKETKTSSESSLDGWTQTGSSFAWSEYGDYSEWGENGIEASDEVSVETKLQEHHKNKETTTSSSPLGDPWTEIGKTENTSWGEYGGWSDWSESAVSGSDSREVQTEQRTRQVHTGTTYHYYRYKYWNIDVGAWYWTCDYNYASNHTDRQVTTEYYDSDKDEGDYNSRGNSFLWWHLSQTENYADQPYTVYRYRDRSLVTTYVYTYEKWGDWTGWADTASTPNNSNDCIYETRNVYRSRTRSKIFTYTYERWGDWSNYGDTPITSSSVTDVQTRMLYRYKIYGQ